MRFLLVDNDCNDSDVIPFIVDLLDHHKVNFIFITFNSDLCYGNSLVYFNTLLFKHVISSLLSVFPLILCQPNVILLSKHIELGCEEMNQLQMNTLETFRGGDVWFVNRYSD